MPVLFTLELTAEDVVEAERLASIIERLECDVHGEVPTRVRLTRQKPDARSVFVTGCCPQLYLVVTRCLALEASPRDAGARRGEPVALAHPRRRPPFAV